MKIAFYDHGLNTELAILFARAGHDVGYYTPWDEAFPKSAKAIIGKGLEGIERIENWERAAKLANALIFPDTFNGEKVDHYRMQGKQVWGGGTACEQLEQDRIGTNNWQKSVGLPTPKRVAIRGVNALIEHLKKVKNKWVKLSKFRGDKETFYHSEYDATQASYLGQMLVDFGANEDLEFLVEDPIEDAVEVGDDRLVVFGKYLSPRVIGYEAKDEGYVCFVTDKPCKPLDLINEKVSPLLKQASTFFSDEVRVTKDGVGYQIDFCGRCPHPPTSVMLELFSNLPFAMLVATNTRLKPVAQYGAGLIVGSEWAEHHWTEVKIDEKVRHLVKLQRAYRDESGRYWALPGSPTVCTCIGFGDSPQEATKQACKTVEGVHVSGASYNTSCLDKIIEETVPAGEKVGIPFA